MFKRICLWAAVSFFLFFSSCSQEPVLSVAGEDDYAVDTVEDGTILEHGSSITISLSEMGSRSTLVRIVLSDEAGAEIASTDVDPSLLKGLGLPMDLPEDLENGVYTLTFSVLDGSVVLHEESRYLYLVSGVFELNSLETYPPGVGPGDSLSARVSLNAAEGSDPWIRWTLDGIVLKEGFLSDTGLLCHFEVPAVEGIYSLMVELFPVEPGDNQVSSVHRQSDLFVDAGGRHEWESSGDRVFRYFIDFSDAMTNKMAPGELPGITGSPSVYHKGQMTGVLFDEEDGLSFDRYALDLLSGGRAREFTLSMAFSFESLPGEGVYHVFSTGTENSCFSIVYDSASGDAGEFVSEFKSYSRAFRSFLPADRLEAGEILYLEIQYEGALGVASISWLSRGELLVRDEGLPVASLEEGSTRLGTDGKKPGFPMVWYTLGVFSEGEASTAAGGGGSAASEELLYKYSYPVPAVISLTDVQLNEGLATLEVQSRSISEGRWHLKMNDADGMLLYSISPVYDSAAPGNESLVLSLIYDERGLFISSSLDANIMGPYEYGGPVTLDIIPDTEGGLEDIQAVRLFRD